MMRIRFPLYAKVLVWFFLNLLFLGLICYGFVKVQFRVGLDSLLMGRTGDRIQAVADIIAAELGASPASQWDEILQRFGRAYQVTFLLLRSDGTPAAGAHVALPADVLSRVVFRRGPPDFAGRGPPRFRSPGPATDFPPPDPPRPPLSPPRFMLRTENPTRYWVGVRLPPPRAPPPRPGPMVLLAVSPSLWGGGLFFDLTPWIAVGAGVVFFSVLFWLPLVRGVTRSISQLTRATEQIAQGRFQTRVEAARRDELGQLGEAVNQMAGRLDGLVSGQKRFLGDIAHELCSPIARIQVALGILEQRTDPKQKPYVNDLQEEVQHMSGLVSELLSFSKASLEPAAVKLQAVSLRDVATRAARREADGRAEVRLEMPDGLLVRADPELLARALANLVRNAVRYAGHAGPITLSGRAEAGQVIITVTDCGPGVPEASLAQLFDPFYRPEPSRSAETGGAGLGLAIVKTCIESCRGTVSCRNRRPAGWEVTVRLEAAPG
ncbi:MAG: HAMP domain-containing histidine kinase [Verrucomicrobia bacterium]|nr:HAMP domain-containing histidine kinase [Verrucomicrobiota bacterium]